MSGLSGRTDADIGLIVPSAKGLRAGWLECDGSEVSRTAYAKLFNVIGETYGAGDGVNTFNIPDLRGEFPRGLDSGRGVDAGRVEGSFQDATAVGSQVVYAAYLEFLNVDRVQNSSNILGEGAGGYSRQQQYQFVRPRNIALMFLIKY